MTIGVGIIGMGVISHYYLKAFEREQVCRLVAVCDKAPARLQAYADSPSVRTYGDYHALLEDPLVDAVVINLPNNLHFQACIDALKAGKHVCCEKPLTLDLEQAEQLREMARRLNLTLLTAFHRRYNTYLINAVEHEVFAQAVHVRARYHERIEDHAGHDTWYLNAAACGGGCIADNGPNVFDTLHVAVGPLRVVNMQVRHGETGIDLGADISLVTPQGLAVSAELSWDYAHGEQKDLVVTYADGTTATVDLLQDSAGFKTSLYHEYEGVLAHLASSIQGVAEDGTMGVEAVRLVRDCYAMTRSPA